MLQRTKIRLALLGLHLAILPESPLPFFKSGSLSNFGVSLQSNLILEDTYDERDLGERGGG